LYLDRGPALAGNSRIAPAANQWMFGGIVFPTICRNASPSRLKKDELLWQFSGHFYKLPILKLCRYAQTHEDQAALNAFLRKLATIALVAITLEKPVVYPSLDGIGTPIDAFR
jgi:hypothetical protein